MNNYVHGYPAIAIAVPTSRNALPVDIICTTRVITFK